MHSTLGRRSKSFAWFSGASLRSRPVRPDIQTCVCNCAEPNDLPVGVKAGEIMEAGSADVALSCS